MRIGVAAVLIGGAVGACIAPALADYDTRIVGNWITSATEDRFGDGGTFVAMTVDSGVGFGIRCIRKKLSIAVLQLGGDPKPLRAGDKFDIKFKVDKQAVVEATGLAIDPRLVQIPTTAPFVKSVRDGREAAMRFATADGVVSTYVFKTGGAKKAFADLSKDCPLD